VRATAALIEKADAELLVARDELDDAADALARAVRDDTLARLVKDCASKESRSRGDLKRKITVHTVRTVRRRAGVAP
jgi:hypothetical protein